MVINSLSEKDFQNAELVSRKENSDTEITIGNNPSLPFIIHKTWNWPLIRVAFFVDGDLIAFLSAMVIRKMYVSLPHFNHCACWVDTAKVKEGFSNLNIEISQIEIHQKFYGFFRDLCGNQEDTELASYSLRVDLGYKELLGKARELSAKKSVGTLIRSFYALSENYDDHKVITELRLKKTISEQLQGFPPSVRRKIHKAERNGLLVSTGGIELLDDFYAVYRQNIHVLGSFALPYLFFINLLQGYEYGLAKIIIVREGEKCVGAAILLSYLQHSENTWFATLKGSNRLYVSYLLHHTMINLAIDAKCKQYSFGRSTKNSGVHKYKQQWGGADRTLYYNYSEPVSRSIASNKIIPKIVRLIPLPIAKLLDGVVSRIVY